MENCPLKRSIDDWLESAVKPALARLSGEYRIAVYRVDCAIKNALMIKVSKGMACYIDGFDYHGPISDAAITTYVYERVKTWVN
jgi:hypothetical protein